MRRLAAILLAMSLAYAVGEAVVARWPVVLAAGVAGGLAFAALGALTLRSG